MMLTILAVGVVIGFIAGTIWEFVAKKRVRKSFLADFAKSVKSLGVFNVAKDEWAVTISAELLNKWDKQVVRNKKSRIPSVIPPLPSIDNVSSKKPLADRPPCMNNGLCVVCRRPTYCCRCAWNDKAKRDAKNKDNCDCDTGC